jgi:hypothetical protein
MSLYDYVGLLLHAQPLWPGEGDEPNCGLHRRAREAMIGARSTVMIGLYANERD